MIHTTFEFIKKFFDEHPDFVGKKVLDVGSLDINGNPRTEFENRGYKYIGSDMQSGPNVDVVVNGHDLSTQFSEEFDIVFCVDTLEHDDAFWLTMEEVWKVLRPGGYLILGMPGRAHYEHRHPYDYWRFMNDAYTQVFFKNYVDVYTQIYYHDLNHLNQNIENEIYGWGQKP